VVTSGIAASRPIELRLLGPLEALVDGHAVSLGGTRQRAVLAILALHRGEAVSVDRLADELWGERPPATATKTVQVYISRLRKALGEGVVGTRGGGYALEVEPDQIDAERFERLAEEGREALGSGDADGAAERLHAALALWRGAPLSDLAYESFAQSATARLEELRLVALEDRIEADLALGRHAALIPELEALIREHPARERLHGQLMIALYRSGRQRDALESYREAQHALVEELGLEPGPELRRLEQAILSQDPTIEAPPRRTSAAMLRERRRAGALIAFGGGVLLAAVVAVVLAGGDGGSEPVDPNTLAVIDPGSDEVVATVPTGVDPNDVSADADHVWVANSGDDTATEVDPETRKVVSTTPAPVPVAGLAAGAGGVWVGDAVGVKLVRIDPAFHSKRTIRLAARPAGSFGIFPDNPVAVGHGAVWTSSGGIVRVDPRGDRVVAEISAGNSPSAIATGAGGVWVTDDADNTLARIDPESANAVTATTPVGQQPSAVAVGEGAVWVANSQDNTVARIDPETAGVTATIPVGLRPTGIAAGGGAVWVANSLSGTVSRIDPRANGVEATIEIGEAPQAVTFAHDAVWVTVQAGAKPPEAPSTEAPDDTARLLVSDDVGSTDPALGANWQLLFATCATLYSYPDRPFPVGARLIPEVAAGEPSVSDDGLTYTFKVRSGFRFSPRSNAPVTAAAFERAIERALSPKLGSYGGYLLREVVGARAYRQGDASRVVGVSADDDTLVIRLTRPVPTLPDRLGAPYFCAVPPDTPIDPEGVEPVPTAGPYYVVSRDQQSVVLRRNPNYGGPRPQELMEIRYTIGTPSGAAVEEVEEGRADYVELNTELQDTVSDQTERRLVVEYGPRSEAASAGRQQLFTQPTANLFSFALNTLRGPFVDARLRRAVNFAIDRPALAEVEVPGVAPPGRPTDQYIPPGIPGFHDVPIYPLGGPDVTTARRLAGDVERHATLYTCNTPGCTRQAEILRSNLRAIGIELDVRQFSIGEMFERVLRPTQPEPWDIVLWGWILDYPNPFDFINTQFATGADHPSGFQDPQMDRRMEEASSLSGEAGLRAYAKLDRDLAERFAPQATFASGEATYFLSARMGCQVLHPVTGLDLAALCIRDDAEED
jgi:YVTN family beta-propeller protein